MRTKKETKETENDLFMEERKIRILELLRANHTVNVNELSELFKVSLPTIRTYLRDMENNGLLIRTHGGAISHSKTGFELTTRQKEVGMLNEKKRIALSALGLIENGDTIILDTGTTTMELARLLNRRQNLTVVTNDIGIARVLEEYPGCTVVLIGGIVRKGFHCTVGLSGIQMCSQLSVDKAFMAANSFSLAKGLSTPDQIHAEIKKAMMKMAGTVILLCDGSKIGKVSFATFASTDEVNVLVTDAVDKNVRKELEKRGIEVITAS